MSIGVTSYRIDQYEESPIIVIEMAVGHTQLIDCRSHTTDRLRQKLFRYASSFFALLAESYCEDSED